MALALPPLAMDQEVDGLLAAGAPVAIGVSGGKDSTALALGVVAHLDAVGHTGPRILVHADLGRVEWTASLPTCERLAEHLGLELVVVRRPAGDLMDRWLSRWRESVRRYVEMECVRVVLPWSTPSMRFCTSELKVDVITRELVRRWPGHAILSASGIRREESPARAKAAIAKRQPKLTRSSGSWGLDWHPILDWTLADVLAAHERAGVALHEAYTTWGSTRVSCRFCIMGSKADLAASTRDPEAMPLYREMVALELESTFGFQGDGKWLADVAPHLLDDPARGRVPDAKRRAAERAQVEDGIPDDLLYVKGWPTRVPTPAEAELLAGVRRRVGALLGLPVRFTTGPEVVARYEELLAEKAEHAAA
jgi:3'-phosphoadenosine 5'-phosphosulfate sulfotransferase (PAPS reductase)/FAD synthetase